MRRREDDENRGGGGGGGGEGGGGGGAAGGGGVEHLRLQDTTVIVDELCADELVPCFSGLQTQFHHTLVRWEQRHTHT